MLHHFLSNPQALDVYSVLHDGRGSHTLNRKIIFGSGKVFGLSLFLSQWAKAGISLAYDCNSGGLGYFALQEQITYKFQGLLVTILFLACLVFPLLIWLWRFTRRPRLKSSPYQSYCWCLGRRKRGQENQKILFRGGTCHITFTHISLAKISSVCMEDAPGVGIILS